MWGGEKLGRPILSPLQNVGIFLFILSTFGLCYSFAVSELSWLIPSRESSFQTNITIRYCRVGKDWAVPFFPPSLIFRSSIDRFVFRFMLLFHSILTFMKDLYQSENQVFNPTRLLVLLHCWVGKDWAGPFFPPPPPPSIMLGSFNLLFSLSVYVTLWLYLNNFEWPIPKRDQVFKPTS